MKNKEKSTEKAAEVIKVKDVKYKGLQFHIGAILHHVSLFVIGCMIGIVLTALVTSFLPVKSTIIMSQKLSVRTRTYYQDNDLKLKTNADQVNAFGIFESMKKSGEKLTRLRRSAVEKSKTNGTTTAVSPTNIPTTPMPQINQNSSQTCLGMNCTCNFTDVKMTTVCNLPFELTDMGLDAIAMKDVINSVFSETVVNRWAKCEPGSWCQPKADVWEVITSMATRWTNGNYQSQICPLLDCLSKLPNTTKCEDEKRSLVIDTVTMLCSMPISRQTRLRDMTCVKHVLMMTHVDMADSNRVNTTTNLTTTAKSLCNIDKHRKSACKDNCNTLFVEFANLELACDSYRYYVRGYGPWKWFYKTGLGDYCDISPGNANGSKITRMTNAFIKQFKDQIIIWVSIISLLIVTCIFIASVYTWRRRRVVYKRAPSIEGECAEMEGLLIT